MKSKGLNEVTLADDAYRYRRRLVDDLIIRLRWPNTTGEEREPPRSEVAIAPARCEGRRATPLVWCTRLAAPGSGARRKLAEESESFGLLPSPAGCYDNRGRGRFTVGPGNG
jgi:hypothetical protein